MKLSEYAQLHGLTYRGAWLRYRKGKIPGATLDDNGRIIIPNTLPRAANKAIVYARVSSNKQRGDLDRQAERMITFANAQGLEIVAVIKEIASGVNDERPKLTKLLSRNDWSILVVEHKDRLSRTGFHWFEVLLAQQGRTISVANRATEERTDLMDDFVAIIYSFAARIYGTRSAKNRAERIKATL